MLSARDAKTARFNADHLHLLVPDKRMEKSYGIASTTDTGNEAIRQPAFCRQDLSSSFPTDDGLEITDHHRIGMGSQNRTENVVGRADIRCPIPHGFADGILQRAASGIDTRDGRS